MHSGVYWFDYLAKAIVTRTSSRSGCGAFSCLLREAGGGSIQRLVFTSLAFHCTEPPGLVAAAAGRGLADRQEVGVSAAVVLIGLVGLGSDALLAPVQRRLGSAAGNQWAAG